MKYTIFYIIIFIYISILLINNKKIIGGTFYNSLEYYNIKKYFKCDYIEGTDILDKINNITLKDCLNKCINDITCTCLHYNPLKNTCFYKRKKKDILLHKEKLISDKNFTSYIKKNNIRNLTKGYMFLTFVEDSPTSINDNLRIITLKKTQLRLDTIVDNNSNYSFFIKHPITNHIIDNILSIEPNLLYPLGYINLYTNLEEMSPYSISFNNIIINEYYKVSTYYIYNPITINFYNSNKQYIDIGTTYKFNIYLLNNFISDNITISTETNTTNIFSNKKYYIAHHNFNSKKSKFNFKNKIFDKNSFNINGIWDFYLEKNKENNYNFCNNKYSFNQNNITNKQCFINNIWKIKYNNYNSTYNFISIDKNLNNKTLEIKNDDNSIYKDFYLNINNIKRINSSPNIKIYFKIIINPAPEYIKKYLYLDKNKSDPILLDRFCYHYTKFNNIQIQNSYSTLHNLTKLNYNLNDTSTYSYNENFKFDQKNIDNFDTCIKACDSNNNDPECIHLNFMINNPNPVNNSNQDNNIYNKHAYIKTKINNINNIKCNYYTQDNSLNTSNIYKKIPNNKSVYLKKNKYNCEQTNNKTIQTLLFKTNDYYNNNEILLWNIEINNPTYKKYKNKKYSLNKLNPPQLNYNAYWTNLKKNIGEIGLGLSCKNYNELDLNIDNIETNQEKKKELINQCSTNNCNYTTLKNVCSNDPLCTNFQISKDQTECYLSRLNNIYLLENDTNPNKNKRITTYFKNI